MGLAEKRINTMFIMNDISKFSGDLIERKDNCHNIFAGDALSGRFGFDYVPGDLRPAVASPIAVNEVLIIPGKMGALATGQLLLALGVIMSLFIGRGDLTVTISGLVAAMGGMYILSLAHPATRQFIGVGWPERICRVSALLAGLLMAASGSISIAERFKDMLFLQAVPDYVLLLIGLLMLAWGLYILILAVWGVRS